MLSTTEELIKEQFEAIKKGSVERVKKLKDYAFVHFKEREDAVNAKNILNSKIFKIFLWKIFLLKTFSCFFIRSNN